MIDKTKYEKLDQYQSKLMQDIDGRALIDAVIEAGRNEDFENLPIKIKEDLDRTSSRDLTLDYYSDEEQEFFIIQTPRRSYTIPLIDERSQEIDYRNIERQLNPALENWRDTQVYIDMRYLYDLEQARLQNSQKDIDTINQDSSTDDPVNTPQTDTEIFNKKRTQIDSEYSINLNDVANALREQGYNVKTKQGGSLLITDENLSSENSITVTKKNAYIETAELKTPETKALYNKMRAAVVESMNESLNNSKEKFEIMETSPKLGELSTQSITRGMLNVFSNDKLNQTPEYSDVFSAPKQKYTFVDKDGNDYLSISMGYSVKETGKNGMDHEVVPVITATYGSEYGDVSKTFEVSEADLKAFTNDQLYKSDIAKAIDEFAEIGINDRESVFKELKHQQFDKEIDRIFKKEFKRLDSEKAEFFSSIAKEYYRIDSPNGSLKDYIMENLNKAPFFRDSMLNEKNEASLSKMFTEVEGKLNPPDLSKLKLSKISLNELSYKLEENGEKIYDSKEREPVEYDREWITKLARMEDKLIDLKNGPVQDMLNTAHSIVKGVNEARQGIVKLYKDGIYSGIEFGNGVGSFREGLNYGHVLHNLEKEYRSLLQSEQAEDQIAAINKKIDIKLYRDDIIRNANIYVKAAIVIRDKVDNMIDLVNGAKLQAEAGLKETGHSYMNSTFVRNTEENFRKLGNGLVSSFKELGYSISEIGKGCAMIGSNTLGLGKDALDIVHNKSAMAVNGFRNQYNDVVVDAKLVLSSKEYAKAYIAEKINDSRIEQGFKGIESNEFNKIAQTRFWNELDNTIKKGQEAEKIPSEDRTEAEKEVIRLGKQARYQKDQNTFIAERLNQQMKEVVLKDNTMTVDKAVDMLAMEYHQSAMAFNVMNGATSVKSYQDLSESEKDMCKDIIRSTIEDMPNVSNKLEHNQDRMEREANSTEKQEIESIEQDDAR